MLFWKFFGAIVGVCFCLCGFYDHTFWGQNPVERLICVEGKRHIVWISVYIHKIWAPWRMFYYWNTHLKKRLAKMGINPVTHKPKNKTPLSFLGLSNNAATLSHMGQW